MQEICLRPEWNMLLILDEWRQTHFTCYLSETYFNWCQCSCISDQAPIGQHVGPTSSSDRRSRAWTEPSSYLIRSGFLCVFVHITAGLETPVLGARRISQGLLWFLVIYQLLFIQGQVNPRVLSLCKLVFAVCTQSVVEASPGGGSSCRGYCHGRPLSHMRSLSFLDWCAFIPSVSCLQCVTLTLIQVCGPEAVRRFLQNQETTEDQSERKCLEEPNSIYCTFVFNITRTMLHSFKNVVLTQNWVNWTL